MALFYIVGGVNHFANTPFYLQMMPPYLPWPLPLVYLSGIIEMGLGVALLIPRISRLAAWGVIALLVAIYPANLFMWTSHMAINGKVIPTGFHIGRLIGQVLLIWWAYSHTKPRPQAS
jgi:uncharacterized membrane protein